MSDTYTVADTYLYALTHWGRATWLEPTYSVNISYEGLDNLKDWYQRMRQRPAVRSTLEFEGLKRPSTVQSLPAVKCLDSGFGACILHGRVSVCRGRSIGRLR
jgi:hypothetical protein